MESERKSTAHSHPAKAPSITWHPALRCGRQQFDTRDAVDPIPDYIRGMQPIPVRFILNGLAITAFFTEDVNDEGACRFDLRSGHLRYGYLELQEDGAWVFFPNLHFERLKTEAEYFGAVLTGWYGGQQVIPLTAMNCPMKIRTWYPLLRDILPLEGLHAV